MKFAPKNPNDGYIPTSWRPVTVTRRDDGTYSAPLAYPPTQPEKVFKGYADAGYIVMADHVCGTKMIPSAVTVAELQTALASKGQKRFTLKEIAEIVGFATCGVSGSVAFKGYMGRLLRAGRIVAGTKGPGASKQHAVADMVTDAVEIE